LTRAACGMLWVTMLIVTSFLTWWMCSSLRIVDCGSSELVGSLMSSTSASTAGVFVIRHLLNIHSHNQ
jgi:hypothetical protein